MVYLDTQKTLQMILVNSEKHKFLVLDSFTRIKSNFQEKIIEKLSKIRLLEILIGSLFR